MNKSGQKSLTLDIASNKFKVWSLIHSANIIHLLTYYYDWSYTLVYKICTISHFNLFFTIFGNRLIFPGPSQICQQKSLTTGQKSSLGFEHVTSRTKNHDVCSTTVAWRNLYIWSQVYTGIAICSVLRERIYFSYRKWILLALF